MFRGIEPFDLGQFGRQCGDERVPCGTRGNERAHAEQRLVDHEVGRHDPVGAIIDHPCAHFAQYATKFTEPRQIAPCAAFALDDMCIGKELRHVDGDARDLVDPVATVLQLGLADQIVEEPGADLPAEQFLALETLGSVTIESGTRPAQTFEHLVLEGLRLVVEPAAVEVEQRVIDDADLRQRLR